MLSVLALAAAATAQPNITYLSCDSVQRGTPMHYDLTVNEAAGVVDMAAYNGINDFPVSRRPAQFSATTVSFLDARISRIDLTLERDSTDILGNPYIERGQCKIVQPVKRAF